MHMHINFDERHTGRDHFQQIDIQYITINPIVLLVVILHKSGLSVFWGQIAHNRLVRNCVRTP